MRCGDVHITMKKRAWFILLTAFSAGGLASSLLVLYMWHVLSRLPPGCYLPQAVLPGVTIDCLRVLTSPYSRIGPVPLDVLASLWFMANIGLVVTYFYLLPANSVLKALYYWRIVGLVILPYLLFVELVVLKALCLYCTIMHIFIIIDFIIITLFIKKIRTFASC